MVGFPGWKAMGSSDQCLKKLVLLTTLRVKDFLGGLRTKSSMEETGKDGHWMISCIFLADTSTGSATKGLSLDLMGKVQ